MICAGPTSAQTEHVLFNGKNLEGWTAQYAAATARDGAIELTAGPGWLRTERTFADFALTFELRLQDDEARATVFVRSCPRFDTDTHVPLNHTRLTLARSPNQTSEWMQVRLECDGDRMSVFVDDRQVAAQVELPNSQGHIAIGTMAGPVQFRNLTLVERPARPTPPEGVFSPGNGVTLPVVVLEVKPRYTATAMQERVSGTVLLSAVVGVDGVPTQVTVLRSLDRTHGLDKEAVAAAEGWRFRPGHREGKPVPILITLEMTFTLGTP